MTQTLLICLTVLANTGLVCYTLAHLSNSYNTANKVNIPEPVEMTEEEKKEIEKYYEEQKNQVATVAQQLQSFFFDDPLDEEDKV